MLEARRRTLTSAGLAAAVFALAATVAWYAESQYNERVVRERELLRAESEAQRSLRTVRDQLELAEHMATSYRELQEAGIFAPIDKPVAIDRAEMTLRPFAAAVTHYQIGGGHEVAQSPLEHSSQYQIDIQRVAVDFEPLHEERFLQVWEAISTLRGPVGGVENCELHRAPVQVGAEHARSDPTHKALPTPLSARCLLTWYRLQAAPPPAPEASPAPTRATRSRSRS